MADLDDDLLARDDEDAEGEGSRLCRRLRQVGIAGNVRGEKNSEQDVDEHDTAS